MEEIPVDFILLLLGGMAVAVAVTIAVFLFKQRQLRRLKDPSKDHYTKRTKRG